MHAVVLSRAEGDPGDEVVQCFWSQGTELLEALVVMGCSGGIVGAGAGGSGTQIALRADSAFCGVPLVMFATRLVRLAICSCTVFIIERNCSSLRRTLEGVTSGRAACAARRKRQRRNRARRSGPVEVQVNLRQDGDQRSHSYHV